MRNKFNKNVTKWRMRSVAKWIVNVCLNGWVLLRGFLRGVLLFMFYKKFAAVVLSAVLVGVVPSVVFADADGISAVSDGDVEELSIEDDFSDGADSISAFASALADKTVSEVQGYQEAKAEAEVIAQERLEAEAAAEAARKAEEERKAAEAARLEKRRGIVDFALQFVGNPYVYGGTSLTMSFLVLLQLSVRLLRRRVLRILRLVIWFFMVRVVLIMWLFILVMARSFTPVQRLQGSRFPTMITVLRLRLVRLWSRIKIRLIYRCEI